MSRILGTWVDHLHDIRQGWILAHTCLEQRLRIACIEPLAYKTLWRRTKPFTTDHTRTHELHEVTQHLCVVDHTREHLLQQRRILCRKHCAKQCRHVLHVAAFATKYSSLRDELRINLLAKLENSFELVVGTRVESSV